MINPYGRSYLITRKEEGDGGIQLFGRAVVKEKEDGIPYLILFKRRELTTLNLNPQMKCLGWVYVCKSEILHVPINAAMPYEVRHALQCVAGIYTSTGFAYRDKTKPAMPAITGDGIVWSCQPEEGTFELESFPYIPESFITILEEKLSIIIHKIM
jgi:hypothetical protein